MSSLTILAFKFLFGLTPDSSKKSLNMYELYINDLRTLIEKEILFSFIITFAALTAANDVLEAKSNFLTFLAYEWESFIKLLDIPKNEIQFGI